MSNTVRTRKKLIEVALPLDVINKASVRENYIYRGNPSSLHKWWAQRPLAAARAVIFAQMVDDPSSHPESFCTEASQEIERQRLFKLVEELVLWENTTNEEVLSRAREEIWQSWRASCAENKDALGGEVIFDPCKLPVFHDPFAGGGTLPLEAQRLGFEIRASDLNPVAVLINKALMQIPPRFAGRAPVNPRTRKEKSLVAKDWRAADGLADDLRYYGELMRTEAENRIGQLYPAVEVTAEQARDRSDLKPLVGSKLSVIGWLWARTVKSPNPAFANIDVPLASTFVLSSKPGREVYVKPIIEGKNYRFEVKIGLSSDIAATKAGTKLTGANFRCLMSASPIPGDYIMKQGQAGRLGSRMIAVVAESERGRVYLAATPEMEAISKQAKPTWKPEVEFLQQALGFRIGNYGFSKWSDVFTDRQLVALTTFCDLLPTTCDQIRLDALALIGDDQRHLREGGGGATAYAEALRVYLAFSIDKHAMYGNSLVPWYTKEDRPKMLFGQQVVAMVWDYVEVNPFSRIGGSLAKSIEIVASALEGLPLRAARADVEQISAPTVRGSASAFVSTDPPYFDNIGYADLSDFFYVWLRRSLQPLFPDLFATVAVPKIEELVATPHRHGGKSQAESFFLKGMTEAMHRLREQTHPVLPITIYYAFKQSETKDEGTSSTGWETFLEAVIQAGFAVTGTWPMRTERTGRTRDRGSNALASSIVLVCRLRADNAPTATRREFIAALMTELPKALAHLQRGNIAPVDLAQAAIGPGMSVYTRYTKVLDASGEPLHVREALALINQTLDEALAEQEGAFDADTRWALAWFDHAGFSEGEYGVAETLSKAKNTSIDGLVAAGILVSKAGKVRLLKPSDMPADWYPSRDHRVTVWEMVHHLIRVLEGTGESGAAELFARLGTKVETARELPYRLYTICERKKRAQEALSYNALVQSWPEIARLAREGGVSRPEQQTNMFGQE